MDKRGKSFEVTVAMLKEKRACADQVAKFKELFGESATGTLQNVRKARKAGLDVGWVAVLLPKPLSDKYDAAVKSLWAKHDAAVKPHWDKYMAAKKPFWDKYVAMEKLLWNKYNEAVDRLIVKCFKEVE